MYQSFFALSELPFESSIDSRFYYVGSAQHEALELLLECMSTNGSICVLSGSSGSGKTTLIRMLMCSLPESMRIIAIDDPRLDAQMLLATILRASGVSAASFESIAELTLKLRQMLERASAQGRITTVICDEAQGLSDEVLEQIRLISNIEGKAGKMINFLLTGQEDLVEHLNKSEHKMLYNRIKAFAILPHFTKEEVQAYVAYRLSKANCHEMIFSNKAIALLTKNSNGIPRVINSICDKAMFLAFKHNKKRICAALVKKATALVFHKKVGFYNIAKQNIKNFFSAIFIKKLTLVVLALGLSASSFAAAFFYLNNFIPHQSLKDSILSADEVKKTYSALLNEIYKGTNKKNIEEALFYQSISNSVFENQSIDTLVKLYGYKRADGELSDCRSIKALDMQCTILQGDINSLKELNRIALVSMSDENMTPYYAILFKLDDKKASLIIDERLFEIKKEYFEHFFLNEYMIIHEDLPTINKRYVSQELLNYLKPRLNAYLERKNYSKEKLNNLSTLAKLDLYLDDKHKDKLEQRDLLILDGLIQQRQLYER